ncbi:MAG: tRNA dihydrouridine(20/20a) synthase DusA, partial [Rhodoferax sp.]
FGACLMNEPALVADCVKAMRDAVSIGVTVKHRIGLDRQENYGFVRDFVGTVSAAGCQVFIVHARNAWLQGLSPKEHREIPPLRYDIAHQLKRDFPGLQIVLNGGLSTSAQVQAQLAAVDAVMVGRAAYHNPWWLSQWDTLCADESPCAASREEVEQQMVDYMQQQGRAGVRWPAIARHMLGLRHGMPGARRWRQVWSSHALRDLPPAQVMAMAHGSSGC